MIKKLDLNNIETIKKVLEIQKLAYKVEAELINYFDIPALNDDINSLKKSNELFLGYYIENELVGIISYKIENFILDIHRLATNPSFFRKGIAKKLICHIEKNNSDIIKIIVSTGKENLPAINFYIKNGFIRIKDTEIVKGLFISLFEKKL